MDLSIECKQAEVSSRFYGNGEVWATLREVDFQSIDLDPIIDARLSDIMKSLMMDEESLDEMRDALTETPRLRELMRRLVGE